MMRKWLSPWQQPEETTKFHVKFHRFRLECCDPLLRDRTEPASNKAPIVIEVKWGCSKRGGLVQFPRTTRRHGHFTTTQRFFDKDATAVLEWDDESIDSTCSSCSTLGSRSSRISFKVLCGDCAESKMRWMVAGKVSWDLVQMALKMDAMVEKKVPITLKMAGNTTEATLTVNISISELRTSDEPQRAVQKQNSARPDTERGKVHVNGGLFRIVNAVMKKQQLQRRSQDEEEPRVSPPSHDSDDLVGLSPVSWSKTPIEDLSARTESTSSDLVKRSGSTSWKRRRLSFGPARRNVPPLMRMRVGDGADLEVDVGRHIHNISSSVNPTGSSSSDLSSGVNETSLELDHRDDNCKASSSCWEVKELASRDGQAKLRAHVFFASFDQRSQKAGGESACSAIAAIVAHFLHLNHYNIQTASNFDSLIKEGSVEWQRLCTNEAYLTSFPNRHFDLETVLEAGVGPLTIRHDRSFVGFFSPEKFKPLEGAMSFDDIWGEITGCKAEQEPRIYIVSWNDHFIVLVVDRHAYHVIDSLGERLFEGCDRAYILKFDESALMYGRAENSKSPGLGMGGSEDPVMKQETKEEVICRGKDCCREYMKRYLAAVPVQELEEEEKKGSVSAFSLHKRLQIEFHYCSPYPPKSAEAEAAAPPSAPTVLFDEKKRTTVPPL